jgi:hypothetical protein
MKLLLVYANGVEAARMLNKLHEFTELKSEKAAKPAPGACYKFLWLGMEVDLLISGPSMMETAFHVGRLLSSGLYHLALHLGTCIDLEGKTSALRLVNVINDKTGDLGIWQDHSLQDAYQSGLMHTEEAPHQRAGFINLTNAYFNVFVDLEKVAAITVNTYNNSDKALANERRKKYGAHIESLNGLGMAYSCLWYKQRFYQLRVPLTLGCNKADESSAHDFLQDQLEIILPLIA